MNIYVDEEVIGVRNCLCPAEVQGKITHKFKDESGEYVRLMSQMNIDMEEDDTKMTCIL